MNHKEPDNTSWGRGQVLGPDACEWRSSDANTVPISSSFPWWVSKQKGSFINKGATGPATHLPTQPCQRTVSVGQLLFLPFKVLLSSLKDLFQDSEKVIVWPTCSFREMGGVISRPTPMTSVRARALTEALPRLIQLQLSCSGMSSHGFKMLSAAGSQPFVWPHQEASDSSECSKAYHYTASLALFLRRAKRVCIIYWRDSLINDYLLHQTVGSWKEGCVCCIQNPAQCLAHNNR